MRCVEVVKQIDLMLDNELNLLQSKEIEQHCSQCNTCQKSYQILEKTKGVLKNQPSLLPTAFLDSQILQAFENHHRQPPKTNFWKHFLIPKPAFALILTLFAIGVGLAFLLGRMSVSKIETELVKSENLPIQIEPKQIQQTTETNEPTVLTVTKYVKVPVFKEKEVIKIVQIEKPIPKIQSQPIIKSGNFDNSSTSKALITKINLEEFQPIAELKTRIVRKGEINE